jgi:NAD(P)-dependent dehydrogenase (short-subunit alcohol dehydrogenase family)
LDVSTKSSLFCFRILEEIHPDPKEYPSMSKTVSSPSPKSQAYIITGPTSGIGLATALELAQHGTVILVGRNPAKLAELQSRIEGRGHRAVSVVGDLSDLTSVRQAAQQIIALGLPLAGLLNNAGVMSPKVAQGAQGWDLTFATNHLGAFALTEILAPHLADGANVVFISSAIEDPERKPAKVMGMRGARFISVEASARGEWKAGGTPMAGIDAYATSKLCVLASTLALARENPRLHFNAVEPGITRGTRLGGEGMNPLVHFLFGLIMSAIPPFSRYASTPKKSARVICTVLTDPSGRTGVYFDEKGRPMVGSELSQDPKFQDLVLAQTRAFLLNAPGA